MDLTDLNLNRFLYKDPLQNLQTKDAVYDASNIIPVPVPPLASGSAAQDINTSNVTINGDTLTPGTFPPGLLDVSNFGWGQTCVFSSASGVKVDWTSGTFRSANGVSYTISAGTTGTMADKTYIYLDLNVSATAYQITTNPATAVGLGKVLIAVAQNSASGNATFNLSEATQIVGDNILANSINASKIITGQLIVGTNVGLGTAQDSAGVTTIIGNTVTTGFINALQITALGAVVAGSFNIGSDKWMVDSSGNQQTNSLQRNDYHWFTIFEAIDGYGTSTAGTGTIICNPEGMDFATGVVNGDISQLQKPTQNSDSNTFNWDKRRKFKCQVQFIDVVNESIYIVCGDGTFGGTGRKIGFYINDTNCFGIVSNGTTTTNGSTPATVGAGSIHTLSVVFTPGVSAKFYIDGTLFDTISANLPSGTPSASLLLDVQIRTETNASKQMRLSFWDFWQEI